MGLYIPGQNQLIEVPLLHTFSLYDYVSYGSTYNVTRKWRYHSANLSHKRCNTKTGVSIMKTIENTCYRYRAKPNIKHQHQQKQH